MGSCGCSSENEFFKIDDKTELVMERFEDCTGCGSQNIQIHILKEKDKECFEDLGHIKRNKLAYWMGKEKNRKSIMIGLYDFEDTLKRKIENTFEAMWYDTISEEELENIPEKLLEKIESEFIRIMLIKIKED